MIQAPYTPAQIRHAYGIDKVSFKGTPGDGRGQTIAIVDAFDDPSIAGDLAKFDAQYGLPAPRSFVELNQAGAPIIESGPLANAPKSDAGWAGEISLDVEWAHAIAPGADLVLVEANSASSANMDAAVDVARNRPGVSVVSMSFGGLVDSLGNFVAGESSSDPSENFHFLAPAGHTGVTFVASSGDDGVAEFPATSPNILSVGGTNLSADASGNYLGETGWSESGGGMSLYESLPSYQAGVFPAGTTKRGNPDVAYVAGSPVSVYDSFSNPTHPWGGATGTSVGAPQWAALIAIANQGRATVGLGSLDGVTQTLSFLYQAPASDFHDITTGSNVGFSAKPGYDLVTGRGTPIANQVISYLDPKASPKTNSGYLIQSDFGLRGNFETVVPLATGGLAHYWRNNDAPGAPWQLGEVFGQSLGQVSSVSMIQSNYSAGAGFGNLEVVARVGDKLAYFWKPDNSSLWQSAGYIQVNGVNVTGVTGTPEMIQGRFGTQGNFELLVPLASGGVAHYWRNNDAPGAPWQLGEIFGQSLGQVSSVSVVESNFTASGNGPGNLEVVARVGNKLAYFWKPDNSSVWQSAGYIQLSGVNVTGVTGTPTMIQSRDGARGDFELVVPLASGGMEYLRRNNDASGLPWQYMGTFGQSLGQVTSISLMQSNYSAGSGFGNLELVAQAGTRFATYWLGDQPSSTWASGSDV
jgi:hypothetical protein